MAVFSYATTEDYELRTGIDVPPDQEETTQIRLDDASGLVALYLGECEDEVASAFPEILTSLICSMVFRFSSNPAGIRSKSIGATSVTYTDDPTAQTGLLAVEQHLLDDLIDRACPEQADNPNVPGLGCVGATWGGAPSGDHWARDIDVWVV